MEPMTRLKNEIYRIPAKLEQSITFFTGDSEEDYIPAERNDIEDGVRFGCFNFHKPGKSAIQPLK